MGLEAESPTGKATVPSQFGACWGTQDIKSRTTAPRLFSWSLGDTCHKAPATGSTDGQAVAQRPQLVEQGLNGGRFGPWRNK